MKRHNPAEINSGQKGKKSSKSYVIGAGTSGLLQSDPFRITYNKDDAIEKGTVSSCFRGKFCNNISQENNIDVAVKIIEASPKVEGEKTLVLLNHSNVVKLLHAENQLTNRCYALELCDASLEEAFSGSYKGSLPSPANVLLQLSLGLEYIHENNVVHQNISPRNALYSVKDRQMKWSGLVTQRGTPRPESFAFWAPEILSRFMPHGVLTKDDAQQQHTVVSNIFAAGCVFAQFLTGGLHPFGEYRQEVMPKIGSDDGDPKCDLFEEPMTTDAKGTNSQARKGYEVDDVSETGMDNDASSVDQSTEKLDSSVLILNIQAVSNIYTNNPVNLGRLSSHYAYGFIKKMLESRPEERLGTLNELINNITSTSKAETEFLDLCALPNPTTEELRQMSRMIQHADVDVNQVDHEGNTPLILLCHRNRRGDNLMESIQSLMENKKDVVDVSKKNKIGYNALHYLCMNCKQHSFNLMDIFKLLVSKTTDLNILDSRGMTVLHYLCKLYQKDNLKDLVEQLASVKSPGLNIAQHCTNQTTNKWTALHFLCRHYNQSNLIDIIRLMIKECPSVINCQTSLGYTALHLLCQHKDDFEEIARLLLDNGANVHLKTTEGKTALDILQDVLKNDESGDNKKAVVQLLLKRINRELPSSESAYSSATGQSSKGRIKCDFKDVLGVGFFGTIFRGTFQEKEGGNEIPVAVKRTTPLNLKKSDNESNALLHLKHENVVKLYCIEDDDKYSFRLFALELCDASLKDFYEKKYAGPVPSPAKFLIQVAKGLEHIHSQDLVHRDIKPANILISSSNGPPMMKWADFGLSKQVNLQGCYKLSGIRGTQLYWPPENYVALTIAKEKGHLQNNYNIVGGEEEGTILSDIFAAGCIFSEFLSGGFHPFGATNDVPNNVRAKNKVNFFKLQNHYVSAMIEKMLDSNPEKRARILSQLIETASKRTAREFPDLCSLPNPTEEEVKQLERMVRFNQADVNQVDDEGYPPILLLCRSNRTGERLMDSINALLSNEDQVCDLNKTDGKGVNAILYLCMNSEQHASSLLDILKLLIHKGVDANVTDGLGKNALHYVCRNYSHDNLIDIVQLLVNKGVDVNSKDHFDNTALNLLCQCYRNPKLIDVVEFLLSKGADVRCRNLYGWNAHHNLCYNNHTNSYRIQIRQKFIDICGHRFENVETKKPRGYTAQMLYDSRINRRALNYY